MWVDKHPGFWGSLHLTHAYISACNVSRIGDPLSTEVGSIVCSFPSTLSTLLSTGFTWTMGKSGLLSYMMFGGDSAQSLIAELAMWVLSEPAITRSMAVMHDGLNARV